MTKKLFFIALLTVLLPFWATAQHNDVREAEQLVKRLIPEFAAQFEFKQVPSGTDTYSLESSNGKIIISGNNANAMATGLNHYLKRYCNTTVSWYADVPVEMPVQAVQPAQPSETEPEAMQPSVEGYSKLSEAEAQAVITALKRYMDEQEPYLNVDLKQSDVAAAVGYPTYLLSAVFTHHLKMGYYDFVNSYRVERFKRSVAEGLHKKYTLVTLAEKCGFKSKASFFRAFKKFTGSTPSEYIQQHGGE